MASTGKRKTTMAKLQRERRLLERRIEKKAKKDARKRAAAGAPTEPGPALGARASARARGPAAARRPAARGRLRAARNSASPTSAGSIES